ncbi:hypothetical protein IP81_15640 [Novosphingobium sp. AAP83]|uniref:MucR family transcriptional regulator n=1 Tax=Novosphingobium sp. AAP83 TaxID=1523425 RepID=UPI0006B9A77C|nr:MucR family transcriptional regulator [Novosphingobium sp. AAP83]KPF90303.1 hypothetical protein IP81_15640 [Novosphingobium sp. AAP83]
MENATLFKLTSDIVCAHVSNNSVGMNDLPKLINSVYQALAKGGEPAPVVDEKPVPTVSIRASVKPDFVTCMECGFKGKALKRHLMIEHAMTPKEYRSRWNLAADHALVAPNYAARRAEIAKAIGLGRKVG